MALAPAHGDASRAAVVEGCLCLVRVRFRSVFRQLHASGRASCASWYAGRCELCVQQWCGWVLGYARLSFERRGVVYRFTGIGVHSCCRLLLTRVQSPALGRVAS